jgi:hypothetical protein
VKHCEAEQTASRSNEIVLAAAERLKNTEIAQRRA